MTLPYAEVLAEIERSQARLESAVADLSDEQARGGSLLPGWSRGHVVTHLARNADALNRFAIGVLSGTQAEMYPGGREARGAAIEEGADRPVELLAADLRFAGRRVIESLRRIGPDQLDTPVLWRKPVTARDVPVLRWCELEIHHLDLGTGYAALNWPGAFVESILDRDLPELADAAPDVAVPDLPRAELLAWLVGRPTRAGLPELPAWPF
ncbi:maleylpyruvate isomerase family mycothiol-dependent enzyme [Rhodococcus sp. NPDC058514]|uniref:maleylpyruvate isomerase family mycothiol-dependent enzyme n=1 Tax=unclassified Rhodococcus (in: high G+C Gram-positive bacteria) TaxID=192944 RepID=UPI003646154E